MKRAFIVGAWGGVLLATGQFAETYGGVAYVPFFVAFMPAVLIGAGAIYGHLAGACGDVSSLDDAVSAGLKYRDDYDPDEEYDDE